MSSRQHQKSPKLTREQREAAARAASLVHAADRLLRKPKAGVTDEHRAAIEAAAQRLNESSRAAELSPSRIEADYRSLEDLLRQHLGYRPKSTLREYAESIGVALLIALIIRAFFVEAFKIPTGSMLPTLHINDHIFVNKAAYGVRIPFVGKYAMTWSAPARGEVIVFEFPGKGPDNGKDYIKRVVATPGDRIRMENNRLIVNDLPVESAIIENASACNDQAGATDGSGLFAGCGGGEVRRASPLDRCRCDVVRESVGERSYVTQHRLGEAFCRTTADWPKEEPERIDAAGEYFGAASTNPEWPNVLIPEGHVFVMGDNRDNSRDGRFWGLVPFDRIKGRAFITWWATDKSRIFNTVE